MALFFGGWKFSEAGKRRRCIYSNFYREDLLQTRAHPTKGDAAIACL